MKWYIWIIIIAAAAYLWMEKERQVLIDQLTDRTMKGYKDLGELAGFTEEDVELFRKGTRKAYEEESYWTLKDLSKMSFAEMIQKKAKEVL